MKMTLGHWCKRILFPVLFLVAMVWGVMTSGCRSGVWGNFGNDAIGSDSTNSGVLTGVVTKASTAGSAIKVNVSLQADTLTGTEKIKGAKVWIEELPDFPHQISDENGGFQVHQTSARTLPRDCPV